MKFLRWLNHLFGYTIVGGTLTFCVNFHTFIVLVKILILCILWIHITHQGSIVLHFLSFSSYTKITICSGRLNFSVLSWALCFPMRLNASQYMNNCFLILLPVLVSSVRLYCRRKVVQVPIISSFATYGEYPIPSVRF